MKHQSTIASLFHGAYVYECLLIVCFVCRLIVHSLPKEAHAEVFIVNSQISHLIRDSKTMHTVYRGLYVYIDFEMGQKQLELEMTDINLLMTKKALI